jgi:glutamyl-tRNA synthetase
LGVPADQAEAFWAVTRENITVLADLDAWWAMFRDGADPLIDLEDAPFVADAIAMLPPKPWTYSTWAEWTDAVKAATGRKGKGLYRPLRRALTGRDAGPEMADVMPLLQVIKAG